jgi:hypothetical protein
VCPPPDTGLQSVVYRLHALVDLDVILLGLAIVDIATVGLLVGTVRATTPKGLRHLYWCAFGAAVAAALPFLGTVVAMAHYAFLELARGKWRPQVLDAHLARHVVCAYIIMLLGASAAVAPGLVTALSARRSSLVTEQRNLEARQLRRWAALCAAPVALQLVWATAWLLTEELRYELYGLLDPDARGGRGNALIEGLVALAAVLATSLAAIAAVALPLRAAARAGLLIQTSPSAFTEPSRFFVTEQP